jgi:hypothetical protein
LPLGDEYIKFVDVTNDLIDFVMFYKIDIDEESGIEFICLRRKINLMILDDDFVNSEEA